MRFEEIFENNENFKLVHLEVDPYRVGEAVDYLLSLKWTEYIYDDIQVNPFFYSSNVGNAFRQIEFITKTDKANDILSLCIGQDFITNAYVVQL